MGNQLVVQDRERSPVRPVSSHGTLRRRSVFSLPPGAMLRLEPLAGPWCMLACVLRARKKFNIDDAESRILLVAYPIRGSRPEEPDHWSDLPSWLLVELV
jgi:hypothetical protein